MRFFTVMVLMVALLVGCAHENASQDTTVHGKTASGTILFKPATKEVQNLVAMVELTDTVRVLGVDRQENRNISMILKGKREYKPGMFIDRFDDISIKEGTPEYRILASRMEKIIVEYDLQNEMIIKIDVQGADPFRMEVLLGRLYSLLYALPRNGEFMKGMTWSQERGQSGRYKVVYTVPDLKDESVSMRFKMDSKGMVAKKGGFTLAGYYHAEGFVRLNHIKGTWEKGVVKYRYGASGERMIKNVKTTWLFNENVVFSMLAE